MRGRTTGLPSTRSSGRSSSAPARRSAVGQRVVGTGGAVAGLAELLVESDQAFVPVPDDFSDTEAVPIQSIGTVIRGRRGACRTSPGSGLLSSARALSASPSSTCSVSAVPVTSWLSTRSHAAQPPALRRRRVRADAERALGPDACRSRPSQHRDRSGRPPARHGPRRHPRRRRLRVTSSDSARSDDDEYVIPYREMYERGITLSSGRTLDRWVDVLRRRPRLPPDAPGRLRRLHHAHRADARRRRRRTRCTPARRSHASRWRWWTRGRMLTGEEGRREPRGLCSVGHPDVHGTR